jgi:hypothetical protein
MAFGAAWRTKGETFLKDEVPQVSEEMPPQSLQTEPQ